MDDGLVDMERNVLARPMKPPQLARLSMQRLATLHLAVRHVLQVVRCGGSDVLCATRTDVPLRHPIRAVAGKACLGRAATARCGEAPCRNKNCCS
eukprot:6186637-Pleurochrysis_carterae.AAC.3